MYLSSVYAECIKNANPFCDFTPKFLCSYLEPIGYSLDGPVTVYTSNIVPLTMSHDMYSHRSPRNNFFRWNTGRKWWCHCTWSTPSHPMSFGYVVATYIPLKGTHLPDRYVQYIKKSFAFLLFPYSTLSSHSLPSINNSTFFIFIWHICGVYRPGIEPRRAGEAGDKGGNIVI